MKKVYVIRSSEDGVIGVYTNKKKVFDKLVFMNQSSNESLTIDIELDRFEWEHKELTYNLLCKELKGGFATVYAEYATYHIDRFYVNQ